MLKKFSRQVRLRVVGKGCAPYAKQDGGANLSDIIPTTNAITVDVDFPHPE
jgi:hypothetical protein